MNANLTQPSLLSGTPHIEINVPATEGRSEKREGRAQDRRVRVGRKRSPSNSNGIFDFLAKK
jgi:hypothetical protein